MQWVLVQIWYSKKFVSEKFTMIFTIFGLPAGKSNKNIQIFPLKALGAGDRGRTDTVSLPQDFELYRKGENAKCCDGQNIILQDIVHSNKTFLQISLVNPW